MLLKKNTFMLLFIYKTFNPNMFFICDKIFIVLWYKYCICMLLHILLID